jgi:glycerol-3-phosphate dehydrogenase (NAD(P)+)
MKISVLGAGAWGTALAASIAPRHDTLLWARDARQAEAIARTRRNERYLPGVELPTALRVGADLEAALAAAGGRGLVVIATPMSGLRGMLQRAAGRGAGVWWLCKGFEAGTMALGHEVGARGLPAGARRRAVGPELRARGGARPAHRAGRRERRRGAARAGRRGLPQPTRCASTRRPTRWAWRSAARSRT